MPRRTLLRSWVISSPRAVSTGRIGARRRHSQRGSRGHLAAYGANGARRYRFGYLDLATLLATPPGQHPWARAVLTGHEDARRKAWLGR